LPIFIKYPDLQPFQLNYSECALNKRANKVWT
jgi:hypothetical protein